MGNRRIAIIISEEDKVWLESYSRTCKISAAEAIRRGIARLRDEGGGSVYKKIVSETRGIWKQANGLEYQKRVRFGWDFPRNKENLKNRKTS